MMLFLLLVDNTPEDADFLAEVYDRHYRLLYGQAYLVLRNPQDAEDAVQTAMLRLTRKIGLLRSLEGNKLASYLVITIRNTAINLYRQNRARAGWQGEADLTALPAVWDQGPEAQALDREAVKALKAAIRRLPTRERDAMTLRFVQGMSDAEVAHSLGIRAVSARALLSRGRKRLKALIMEGRGQDGQR